MAGFYGSMRKISSVGRIFEKLEKEVTFHVRRLRQHPCLALWSGDNENDTAILWGTNGRVDPNSNRNTRRVIPEVLRMNDYVREYLPSSPYIDEVAFKNHAGDSRIPEQHLWGPRDYYKGDFYKNAIAHFASETGYHGCPSVKSIRKFISEKALWPYQLNGEWRFMHPVRRRKWRNPVCIPD